MEGKENRSPQKKKCVVKAATERWGKKREVERKNSEFMGLSLWTTRGQRWRL